MSATGNATAGQAAPFVLEDSGSPAIDALFRAPAFGSRLDEGGDMASDKPSEQRFVAAMAESYAHHLAGSREYRSHVEMASNAPSKIADMNDVERIPWMFVQSFKEAELSSVPWEDIEIVLTSSGTGGVQTKTLLDHTSLNRLQAAGYEVYRGMGIVEPGASPCNYLLFTYDIDDAPRLGTAWTTDYLSRMVPAAGRVFLIRKKTPTSEMEFDLDLALMKYREFVESGLPLRILGFPAFIYHTFLEVKRRGWSALSSKAAAQSWVLTGGGWKNHKGEYIGKRDFAKFIGDATHVPVGHVRDLFGMAEHGIGYTDCEFGRLHVPSYAHAVTRDPMTLEVQPPGIAGILQLFTPLLKSSPALSLLTTDEVILHSEACRCGRSGLGLEYIGRLGLSQYDGCAIRSLEYLKS
jgi:hypothetical protein